MIAPTLAGYPSPLIREWTRTNEDQTGKKEESGQSAFIRVPEKESRRLLERKQVGDQVGYLLIRQVGGVILVHHAGRETLRDHRVRIADRLLHGVMVQMTAPWLSRY